MTKLSTTKATTTTVLDKSINEFGKISEYQSRYNHKPCKNLSVSEYLSLRTHPLNGIRSDQPPPNLTKIPILASQIQRIDHNKQQSPISIAVEHDTFDINYGLVRNIIYTGILSRLIYMWICYHSTAGRGRGEGVMK